MSGQEERCEKAEETLRRVLEYADPPTSPQLGGQPHVFTRRPGERLIEEIDALTAAADKWMGQARESERLLRISETANSVTPAQWTALIAVEADLTRSASLRAQEAEAELAAMTTERARPPAHFTEAEARCSAMVASDDSVAQRLIQVEAERDQLLADYTDRSNAYEDEVTNHNRTMERLAGTEAEVERLRAALEKAIVDLDRYRPLGAKAHHGLRAALDNEDTHIEEPTLVKVRASELPWAKAHEATLGVVKPPNKDGG